MADCLDRTAIHQKASVPAAVCPEILDPNTPNERALISLPTKLPAGFTDYQFALPSQSLQQFCIVLPGPALVRLRAIRLDASTLQALPLWKCTKDTQFNGVCQPHPSRHWHLGDTLAVPVTADSLDLMISPGPLPAVSRLLRLNLAVERLSVELAESLSEFLRRRAEDAAREKERVDHEGREMLRLIEWPQVETSELLQERDRQLARQAAVLCAKDAAILALEQQLRVIQQSQSWRFTAPFRQGKGWLQHLLRPPSGK